MDKFTQAYWRGFWKTAMMMGGGGSAHQQQRPRPLQQPAPPPMMQQMPNPQVQQIQQMMKMLPMPAQQGFERQLAGKFGMKGQSFLMNPSAHL